LLRRDKVHEDGHGGIFGRYEKIINIFTRPAAPDQSLWKWSKMTGSVRDPAYQFLRLSFGRLEIDDLRKVGVRGGIS